MRRNGKVIGLGSSLRAKAPGVTRLACDDDEAHLSIGRYFESSLEDKMFVLIFNPDPA